VRQRIHFGLPPLPFSMPGSPTPAAPEDCQPALWHVHLFRTAISGFDHLLVELNGPGGLLEEGLIIGREIRARHFATVVAPIGRKGKFTKASEPYRSRAAVRHISMAVMTHRWAGPDEPRWPQLRIISFARGI
jgi:hypothetical protein